MTERVPPSPAGVEIRFTNGDEDAFEALFRDWHGVVYRWVFRIVRDHGTAEDVTAEAFWRAYRARARFDPSRNFGAWVRRIATNVALTALKRARRDAKDQAPLTDVRAPGETASREARAAILIAMRRLSPKLRLVVLLALVEDQPYAEIADALGVSVGTVKTRVSRGTRQLRRELTTLGIQP